MVHCKQYIFFWCNASECCASQSQRGHSWAGKKYNTINLQQMYMLKIQFF